MQDNFATEVHVHKNSCAVKCDRLTLKGKARDSSVRKQCCAKLFKLCL